MKDVIQHFNDSGKILLFDGAMGTEIYQRGVYINQCFESLNLTRPELISSIHEDYVEAGADVIETNTYSANRFKLAKHGYEGQVKEILGQGLKLAKAAAKDKAYVAASIGPSGKLLEPYGSADAEEVAEIFTEQFQVVEEEGVDLYLLESFRNLEELEIALRALQAFNSDIPVMAQMALGENGFSAFGQSLQNLAQLKEKYDLFSIGANCGLGPKLLWEFLKKFRGQYDGILSAQPNAGYPKIFDGRMIYMATPEYFAEYAKRMIQSGINIVGACCGAGPAHVKTMKSAILALQPGRVVVKHMVKKAVEPEKVERIEPFPVAERSNLARKLYNKEFVISVEIDPPRGTNFEKAMAAAKALTDFGVDAINIADGPRATTRMSPLALSLMFKEKYNVEPILHYCCRDRNILGMQSDLLGAQALGIKNVLLITGDPPKLGDYPDATAVFDLDAIGLTRIVHNLNEGVDIASKSIGGQTGFFIGVGANPGALDLDKEVKRYIQKVKAGAEYVLTQPVYDVDLLREFLKRTEEYRIPVLVGILPLISARNAEFLHNEVPGMQIPDPVLNLMRKVGSGPEAMDTGIKIAREALAQARDMVDGVYIMPPFGKADLAIRILEK